MSIFISIASYRDSELPKTVKSLYDNAENPQELVFGIVSQDTDYPIFDGIPVDQIRIILVDPANARGVGYARKIAMELYEDEDYFFQIDSHMRFAHKWDTTLKEMLSWCQAQEKTDRVILSQFPAPYIPLDNGTDFYPKNHEFFWDKPSWTSVTNPWLNMWGGQRQEIKDLSRPHYSHTVLGSFIFAYGFITKEIPYDERISYMGEEVCFAIRAYTRGWHIYAPNKMVAWHFYRRDDRPRIQSDNDDWHLMEGISQDVQRNVLLSIEDGVYGVADYQKYLQYQSMIGINFEKVYKGVTS